MNPEQIFQMEGYLTFRSRTLKPKRSIDDQSSHLGKLRTPDHGQEKKTKEFKLIKECTVMDLASSTTAGQGGKR